MKDVTSDEMTCILNTPSHNEDFKDHLKSIFKIVDVKGDKNLGFYSIILGLNNVKNKKVYEKITNFTSKHT